MEFPKDIGVEGKEIDFGRLVAWYNEKYYIKPEWLRIDPVVNLDEFLGVVGKHTIFAVNAQTGKHLLLLHSDPVRLIRVPEILVQKLMENAFHKQEYAKLLQLEKENDDLRKQVKDCNRRESHQHAQISSLQKDKRFLVCALFLAFSLGFGASVTVMKYFSEAPAEAKKVQKDGEKIQDEFRFKIAAPYERAEMLHVHDQNEQALIEINTALDDHAAKKIQDPADRLLMLRGLIYQKLGNPALAIADLEEAGRTMPFKITPEPWTTLQRLYVETGNHQKARICRQIVEGIVDEGGRNRGVIEADINELLEKRR